MAKRIFVLALLISGFGVSLLAQSGSYAYTLERGGFFHKAAWRDSMYRFTEFQNSTINYNGQHSNHLKAVMNYNLFLTRMELIAENGDTVALQNFHNIQFIKIGNHTFYNHRSQGYLEVVPSGRLNIAIKHWLKVVMESGTGEKFLITDYGLRETSTRYDRTYTKEKTYFLLDDHLKIHRPTLRIFEQLLPEFKEIISAYFRKNKLDLRREQDFLLLLNYCRKITPEVSSIR